MTTNRVTLVDGSYLAHRHLDVNPKAKGSSPRTTDPLLDTVKTLLHLYVASKARHFGVVFDGPIQSSWRRQLLPVYKAGSDADGCEDGGMSLEAHRESVLHFCDELGLCSIAHRGFEALDVMATYTTWADSMAECYQVILLSGHRLSFSLVGPRVLVARPELPRKLLDADAVAQQWGVRPDQLPDFLALVGRPKDGILGVPGIGLKTAAKLLQTHGNLEELLLAAIEGTSLKSLGPAKLQALQSNAETVRLGRRLSNPKPVPGCPGSEGFKPLARRELNFVRGIKWCEDRGYTGLLRKLEDMEVGAHADGAEQPRNWRSAHSGSNDVRSAPSSRSALAAGTSTTEALVCADGGEGVSQPAATPPRSTVEAAAPTQLQDASSRGVAGSYESLWPGFDERIAFQRGSLEKLPSLQATAGTCIVQDEASALHAMDVLRKATDRMWAVHFGLDSLEQDAKIICFSVYGGHDLDFGSGPRLWVDVEKLRADASPLEYFREFFEDGGHPKVYYNYSQGRRALNHAGVGHAAFAGDTMQMARLWDASLSQLDEVDYSLSSLTLYCLGDSYQQRPSADVFGKDAKTPLKLQLGDDDVRTRWIEHSTYGAVSTYYLWHDFRQRLQMLHWQPLHGNLPDHSKWERNGRDMLDFYEEYWRPFGEILSDMEVTGIRVDLEKLKALEAEATAEREALERDVRDWVVDVARKRHGDVYVESSNIRFFNIASDKQLQLLLFGGEAERSHRKTMPDEGVFLGPPSVAVPQDSTDGPAEAQEAGEDVLGADSSDYENMNVDELKTALRERGLRLSGKKADLIARLRMPAGEAPRSRQAGTKRLQVKVKSLGLGLKPVAYTTKGLPSVSSDNLKALCKEQAGVLGPAGVHAIESCLALSELDTLIGTFLRPLQSHGRSGRVHSSFNLNTETGRLSSLNPNLQNVPYGGRFRVRDAFVAGPGKCFVIADYAQLELRVVAHLAACRPMIDALNAGGDFHSRTAAKMFPEITKAIKRGEVVLEGGDDSATSSSSGPPAVRERFAEERRKAKTLNFSVLYGKTEFGLAKDWGKTRKQAANIIRRWFSAFPEIEVWQEKMRDYAMKHEGVTTLLGRSRKLYDVGSANENMRNAALRAAINTPVQGSAADIVTMAMLKLHESELLQQLGFRLVLQIHDEVILEGPIEHGDRAREEVVRVMENPLPFHLMAELKVDSRTATFWNRG